MTRPLILTAAPARLQHARKRRLRGGISVALALSLPPGSSRDALVTITYAVVVFSILVQGLTINRVLGEGPQAS